MAGESRGSGGVAEEAARRAEEAAVEALTRLLGIGRTDFFVVVLVNEKQDGVDVAVDVYVRGVRALGMDRVEAAVSEAVEAARRAVEEVLSRRGRRRRGRGARGSQRSESQEPGGRVHRSHA